MTSLLGRDPFGAGFRALQQLSADIGGGNTEGVKKAALVLEKKLKEKLSHPGSGRTYPARKGRGKHQASAPGEPPAPDLGDLRKSIGQEVVNGKRRVGTGLRRAPSLEFGNIWPTSTGGNRVLAPRPFMRPAVEEATEDMKSEMIGDLRIRGQRLNVRGD